MKHHNYLIYGLFCGLASGLFAQTDQARFVGVVADATGSTVIGATVTVKNDKTGAVRIASTNNQGQYLVTNLQPSDYTVSAKAAGLTSPQYSAVQLEVGQERTLNITVQVESLAQTVEVSGGDLAVVDTSSAKIGVNVSEREVASMPLNGRQLSQLYLLAPGAQTAGGGSFVLAGGQTNRMPSGSTVLKAVR